MSCWACGSTRSARLGLYALFLRHALEAAGLEMCGSCRQRFVRWDAHRIELPGLVEYGRVYAREGNPAFKGKLPTAYVFRTVAPNCPNGELLYRLAYPDKEVFWERSIPGWVFMRSHE